MSTVHNHSQSHTTGCSGHNCRTKRVKQTNSENLSNIALGVLGAISIFNTARQYIPSSKLSSSDNTSVIGNLNRSSEEIQADIDKIYSNYGVTDESDLTKKVVEAEAAVSKSTEAVAIGEKNVDTAKITVNETKNNVKVAKDKLSGAEATLRNAINALNGVSYDDPNYQTLVSQKVDAEFARNQAKIEKEQLEQQAVEAEEALNKANGELKQLKAEEKVKKEEYDAIVNAQEQIKKLNEQLEKAKLRETKEKERADAAEAKRKREEEIDHLSNGDTAAISKLLRQIRNAESMNLDQREDKLRAQLDAALEQYYKNHKVGDNATIDSLPEAKIHQPAA